jgi:hypothetical protein
MPSLFRWFAAVCLYIDPTGLLTGRVRDCNGKAVASVEVCVQVSSGHTACTSTDRQGWFEFPRVPEGKVGVFVAGDRWFAARYRAVEIRNRQTTSVNFVVIPVSVGATRCE